MKRGMAWLDTGTHEALLEAAHFIETIERRQGLKIACPEEVAYRMGYIDARQLEALARPLEQSSYGEYLRSVLSEPMYRGRSFRPSAPQCCCSSRRSTRTG